MRLITYETTCCHYRFVPLNCRPKTIHCPECQKTATVRRVTPRRLPADEKLISVYDEIIKKEPLH